METIGNRAAKEIKKRAKQNGVSSYKEAGKMEISNKLLCAWQKNINPSAYYLQQMALAGYDVIYILTGEKDCGN